ncbi:MAG: hemolysin family protein [Mariprofundaceae bacterium]|nr:hemolysin family protein [Mariprofundaceae bacterium]
MRDHIPERWRAKLLHYFRPGKTEIELLDVIQRAEAIQSDVHRDMLGNLLCFSHTRVRELMVPRLDMHALNIDLAFTDAVQTVASGGFTRWPVFKGDLDHVQGMVHAWDMFSAQSLGKSPPLETIIKECIQVPEFQLIPGLLMKMKKTGCHLAVVVDEYGGTAGLVTMADILSEIVGSIVESDDSHVEWERQLDGSYIVYARMGVDELSEELGLRFPAGDYDSIGGMLTFYCQRIPCVGEEVDIENLRFKVLEASARRIIRLQIFKHVSH